MDPQTIQLATTILCCIISVIAFIRSGSSKSKDDAKAETEKIVRIETKLDSLIVDVKDIKKQNIDSMKSNSQAEERFKTLFAWKSDIEEWRKTIERK